ncbi:MAG: hypothetical protein MHMPM18_000276 [Marteilia pararefringens]
MSWSNVEQNKPLVADCNKMDVVPRQFKKHLRRSRSGPPGVRNEKIREARALLQAMGTDASSKSIPKEASIGSGKTKPKEFADFSNTAGQTVLSTIYELENKYNNMTRTQKLCPAASGGLLTRVKIAFNSNSTLKSSTVSTVERLNFIGFAFQYITCLNDYNFLRQDPSPICTKIASDIVKFHIAITKYEDFAELLKSIPNPNERVVAVGKILQDDMKRIFPIFNSNHNKLALKCVDKEELSKKQMSRIISYLKRKSDTYQKAILSEIILICGPVIMGDAYEKRCNLQVICDLWSRILFKDVKTKDAEKLVKLYSATSKFLFMFLRQCSWNNINFGD